ncbi:peptide ABC transporter substrate-binding protein [Gottfriedia acidiceleris]|uniref:peptide ABC transporter substrate-binding protein n=1 Tax=Gottfriedia acidiceleris TaxID=371036 RepID=UPI003AF44072
MSACGTDKEQTSAKVETKRVPEQVLNVTENAEIPSMDSTLATDAVSFRVMNNVLEGLYRLDRQNKPQPAMAKSVEISKDKKTYTFNLRDAKWSNGNLVTAQDFVYAWKRAVDPATAAEYAYILFDVKNAEEINNKKMPVDQLGVKAIDDHTFEVQLKNPVPYFLDLITSPTFYPLNEKFVKEQGQKHGLEANTVLYNGPFVLKEWNHEQNFKLEKNPNYWDKAKVKLKEVNVNVVKDVSTAVNLYESKQIDIVNLSSEFVDKYKGRKELRTKLDFRSYFLRMNERNKLFKSADARKAISLVIDKKQITDVILNNGSIPSDYLVPKNMSRGPDGKDFRATTGTFNKMDLNKGKELWEHAKKELGTDKFTIELLNYDNEDAKKIGEYLKEQLEKNLSGLTVNIKQQPFSQKLDLEKKMDYDMSLSSWGYDYPDPMTFLDMFVTDGAFNQTGYTNPGFDKLIQESKGELLYNLPARWEALKKAEKVLLDDAAIVPIYQKGASYLLRSNVKGFYYASALDTYKDVYIVK